MIIRNINQHGFGQSIYIIYRELYYDQPSTNAGYKMYMPDVSMTRVHSLTAVTHI